MSNSGVDHIDEPLGFALAAAARKLSKFYTAALSGSPVTASQLFFLRQLWHEDGLSLAVLRERAQLDATSATWLADQLEKARLIERRRDSPDRRVVRIVLTTAGRALQDELEPRLATWEGSLASALERHHTPAEIATFRAVLRTSVETLPDGNDLWSAVEARWDRSLAALQTMLEADERARTEIERGQGGQRGDGTA